MLIINRRILDYLSFPERSTKKNKTTLLNFKGINKKKKKLGGRLGMSLYDSASIKKKYLPSLDSISNN